MLIQLMSFRLFLNLDVNAYELTDEWFRVRNIKNIITLVKELEIQNITSELPA